MHHRKILFSGILRVFMMMHTVVFALQPDNTLSVVADGGAVGDGISDDTDEINATISRALSQAKDVYFPVGEYKISGDIIAKNGVSLYGDFSGVSLIKAASGVQMIGDDIKANVVKNVDIKDLFLLNVQVFFLGKTASITKENISVARCVSIATNANYYTTRAGYQMNVEAVNNISFEDNILLQAASSQAKGLQTDTCNGVVVRYTIIGMDLNNLSWLDTEWKGYGSWDNIEVKLGEVKLTHGFDDDMGRIEQGHKSLSDTDVLVRGNIYNGSPADDSDSSIQDHAAYVRDWTNFDFVENWVRGWPNGASGGIKFRNANGPGAVAANKLVNTPYISAGNASSTLPEAYSNMLLYRNYFVLDAEYFTELEKHGIYYQENGGVDAEDLNNEYAENIYSCASGEVPIKLFVVDVSGHTIYDSNVYEGTGIPINIDSPNGLVSPESGAPDLSRTDSYQNYTIPHLNIPEYGEDPPAPPGPGTLEFDVVDDSTVKKVDPDAVFGTSAVMNLRGEGDKEMNAYLKFTVSEVPGTISEVKVKLYSLHAHTVEILRVNDVSWNETSMTWNSRASMNNSIMTQPVGANEWVELDVTDVVTSNGTYAFGLKTTSGSYRNFSSKEGANPPKLLVTHTGASADGDLDDDLIPDVWEMEYFGNATNAVSGLDPDEDGFDNLAEYISGTIPTNGNSWFVVENRGCQSGMMVSWHSVSGRVYDVGFSSSITNTFTNIVSGIHYPKDTYIDSEPRAGSSGFYRVDVRIP